MLNPLSYEGLKTSQKIPDYKKNSPCNKKAYCDLAIRGFLGPLANISRRHYTHGHYITSTGGKEDHRDDGDTWVRRGVGIPPSGGGNGQQGTPPHQRVHQEAAGDHSGKGGMPPTYELCFMADQMPGKIPMVRWWNQDVVNEPEE